MKVSEWLRRFVLWATTYFKKSFWLGRGECIPGTRSGCRWAGSLKSTIPPQMESDVQIFWMADQNETVFVPLDGHFIVRDKAFKVTGSDEGNGASSERVRLKKLLVLKPGDKVSGGGHCLMRIEPSATRRDGPVAMFDERDNPRITLACSGDKIGNLWGTRWEVKRIVSQGDPKVVLEKVE
jgi:hypothetical protein